MRRITQRALCSAAWSLSTASTAATATVSAPIRQIVYFTDAEPELSRLAIEKKYTSSVWVEADDLRSLQTTPKDSESPNTVVAVKRLEVFNGDLIQNLPDAFHASPAVHSSAVSGKAYGKTVQFELEQRAVLGNFKNRWWFSAGEIRKKQLQLRTGALSSIVLMKSPATLYNACQLANPDAAVFQAWSAGSRRMYPKESSALLSEFQKAQRFSTGLFFSQRQLLELKLTLKANATGMSMPIGSGFGSRSSNTAYDIYAVEDVENYAKLLDAVQRPMVEEPTFLMSGTPVRNAVLLDTIRKRTDLTENYFVSGKEIQEHGFTVKKGAVPMKFSDKVLTNTVFNADETTDPQLALKVAGTAIR